MLVLESELRGARVFVDEFKARLQEWRLILRGDRRAKERPRDTSEVIGRLAVAEPTDSL